MANPEPGGEPEVFQSVTYAPEEDEWIACSDDDAMYSSLPAVIPGSLSISTYSVLGEVAWQPSTDRFPLLVRTIVAANAAADVLVLQEVTDHFLSALLADNGVRCAYPFASHGPPDQADMDPLPGHLNTVVLSRRPFSWTRRVHEGGLIARFGFQGDEDDDVEEKEKEKRYELVMATTHLTHSLTDGSVNAKRTDLTSVLDHLRQNYPPSVAEAVVVVADNLNMHSSTQSAQYVETGFDDLLDQYSFVDVFGGHADDDDDEQGSTHNQFTNALAASINGTDLSNRPERFDRIYARGRYAVTHYNSFGFPSQEADHSSPAAYASDHWGIRCILRVVEEEEQEDDNDDDAKKVNPSATDTDRKGQQSISAEVEKLIEPVVPVHAPAGPLADADAVTSALQEQHAIPSQDDVARYKAAFERLKAILLNESQESQEPQELQEPSTTTTASNHPRRQLVVVPVGSYGLGVWTPASSDMDCLCVGAFGSQTFFALASQRLRAAGAAGAAASASADTDSASSMRIIRRVRAQSGTRLELEVDGVRMHLQYCSAALVAETWPVALVLPASHALFSSISPQVLAKLMPARDLHCLRTSFPETTTTTTTTDNAGPAAICTAHNFRTAHRAIKQWSRARGLYAARFGYLGGIQISMLLARVMKFMQRAASSESVEHHYTVADILVTFFQHYAGFDWTTKMAFDPFFHHDKAPYSPISREPLMILGYHRPQLNTSAAASAASVRVLAEEFQRAASLLSGNGLTWREFLAGGTHVVSATPGQLPPGPAEFVRAYRSYIKLDMHYWGLSLSRGSAFVGWLESRCVLLLLVDLARRLPALNARIWPGRFVEVDKTDGSDGSDGDNEERQYQGCYLIGLGLPEGMRREERRMAQGTLQSVLAHFEKQIRRGGGGNASQANFDPQWQWIGLGIVNRDELGDVDRLQLDSRVWEAYAEEEEEEDDDDDEMMEDDDDDDADDNWTKAKAKKGKNKKKPLAVVHQPGGPKFRTAQDVIKRLRWDPHLDGSDFVVGYEDRFLGAREKPLDAWKAEQTDDEFIPQHRILYFRRRSDGEVVWDRRTRRDVLWGVA